MLDMSLAHTNRYLFGMSKDFTNFMGQFQQRRVSVGFFFDKLVLFGINRVLNWINALIIKVSVGSSHLMN
jgi:hypothetical protein